MYIGKVSDYKLISYQIIIIFYLKKKEESISNLLFHNKSMKNLQLLDKSHLSL